MSKSTKAKGFKMPHIFFLMLGLILIMSLLTYVVPAGQFAADEKGALLGDQFSFLDAQTPVSPWRALLMLFDGIKNSGFVIALLLVSGGTMGIILGTGAIDEVTNWAIYKLQDKGVTVLIPIVFFLLGIIGGFGGGDAMIAIVPIGIMLAKKLRLDPIVAVGVTFFASFIGFGTGPTNLMLPQVMMELPIYSGFGSRMFALIMCLTIGCIYLTRYALKISKDPTKSLMGNTDWLEDCDNAGTMEEVKLNPRAVMVTLIFLLQYAVIVYFFLVLKKGYEYMPAVLMVAAILCGIIYKKSADEIGNEFAKGASGMGFICFIIGLATTMNLVMKTGNILHTLVFYATKPLNSIPVQVSAIGMSSIIAFVNVLIPSASAKAAILFPIIKPISEAIGMTPQLAVSAFQYGDGFTNLVSPALGVTVGSLSLAGVPYTKWFKFVMPVIIMMFLACMVLLYVLGASGWTGM
jgi:uncharacterized ion transporter superfamily protein YfcC